MNTTTLGKWSNKNLRGYANGWDSEFHWPAGRDNTKLLCMYKFFSSHPLHSEYFFLYLQVFPNFFVVYLGASCEWSSFVSCGSIFAGFYILKIMIIHINNLLMLSVLGAVFCKNYIDLLSSWRN